MKKELKPGDQVQFDIVLGDHSVRGQGVVTAVTPRGPRISPSLPLPNKAQLQNIEKV